MFSMPSLLSIFYACAIALNTQLVFVHNRVPKGKKKILYFVVPPILSLTISRSLGRFPFAPLTPIDLLQLFPLSSPVYMVSTTLTAIVGITPITSRRARSFSALS